MLESTFSIWVSFMHLFLIFPFLLCCLMACGRDSLQNQPDTKGYQIKGLESLEKKAQSQKNFPLEARTRLKINLLLEKQEKKSSAELENLKRKYTLLETILEKEISDWNHKTQQRSLLRNTGEKDRSLRAYPGPSFSSVYHPLVLAEVKRVFKDFGDLYIKETTDHSGNIGVHEVQVKKPWSGYWYPFTNRSLYDNQNQSPLEKYDTLMTKLGHNSSSSSEEKRRRQSLNPASWEGLCDAWSLASISTSEPRESKTIEGITFSPADQKALYTFSHLKLPYKQYGITYRGDADTDGTYQDIKPEAFHKIVTSTLSKQKKALIVDDMAGVQIWNKPLYRYRWKVTQDPDMDCAFLVKAYPWLIKERSQESDRPTSSRDTIAPIYYYRLYVDKTISNSKGYLVIAGQWIKESYRDHPDTVKVLLDESHLGSHNKEFNKNIKTFERLFISS